MRHCERVCQILLRIHPHVLPSWVHGSAREVARPAVSLHTHCLCASQPAVPAQTKCRYSSSTSQVKSGLHVSQELLQQLEASVSQLDSMVGQLNDTSSLKAEQIRDLRRQVNRLEPVSALVSQHRHLESEVLLRPSAPTEPLTEMNTANGTQQV